MMLFKSILPLVAVLFAIFLAGNAQSIYAQGNTKYCNAVQNDVGLIRYPLGQIAVSSTDAGEIADAMTLVPRVYPCLNSIVVREEKDDWRTSISGDPSMLIVNYQADKPSGATTAAITVAPHVSVFKVSFPEETQDKYLVFDFTKYRVDNWAALYKWTKRTINRIDDRTIQATIGEPGKKGAYYTIKFSVPCTGSGTIDSAGVITDGASQVTGTSLGIYARFESPTVTVAVAISFTSMDQTKEFLASEFTDFDAAQKRCHTAWNEALNRLELEGTENSKRMAYTALYTLLVNIIDGSEGSCYLKYYDHPKNLASSAYWQFIGGFQSCCWDNFRTAYPFLMLAYPEVMSDVLNTYLAKYQRDGFVAGNTCLFTGPTGGHIGVRFTPVLAAEAWANQIKVDYTKLYDALRSNYNDDRYVPESLRRLGYETQPPAGGKACSQTLEWSTSFYSLAQLAKAQNDKRQMEEYFNLSKCYKNLWDSENLIFRVKNEDGTWGTMVKASGLRGGNWTWNPNPQGLFEGTSFDWMFSVPHDPYGLINLPGQKDFVERVTEYCLKDTWFNDYQYHYPYLLYYAGAPNVAQKILRNIWVPLFKDGIIYEGVSPDPTYKPWKTHYTSDAGWLLCSMLGLYPVPSPAGQLIISSPSVTKAVFHHGDKAITVLAHNNSDKNIYIASIKINDKIYPSYLIPARLAVGKKIDLEMSSDSTAGLGNLYVSSSDGYVETAELLSDTHLKCTIEAAVMNATTKFYCNQKPIKILINRKPTDTVNFDDTNKIATIQTKGTTTIDVFTE